MSGIEIAIFWLGFLIILQLPIAAIIGLHLEYQGVPYVKRMVISTLGGMSSIFIIGYVLGVIQ